MDKRLTQIQDNKNQKLLEPVKEMRESNNTSTSKATPIKLTETPHKKNKNETLNVQEVTGNSFFNDVTLNMKKNESNPHISLKKNPSNMISKSNPSSNLNKIPEENISKTNPQGQGFNVYQMEQAKPNVEAQIQPESQKKDNESSLGTKIKRQNVNNDLNCTINDESILEYIVDENGYLMTEKGQLIYDDDGKVVKLTDHQIDKFKDEKMYEEVEY